MSICFQWNKKKHCYEKSFHLIVTNDQLIGFNMRMHFFLSHLSDGAQFGVNEMLWNWTCFGCFFISIESRLAAGEVQIENEHLVFDRFDKSIELQLPWHATKK